MNWPLVTALSIFLLLTVVIPSVVALIDARFDLLSQDPKFRQPTFTLKLKLHEYLPTSIALGWVFFVGASFGSFMNVLVYRMPNGISIWKKGSRCPWCYVDIRPSDNIPVFGWIQLRGRCRACRLPIAARYPLVEFAVGMAFVLVVWRELFSGGANLPLYDASMYRGAANNLFSPNFHLISITLFHLFLVFLLISFALIRLDNFPLPKKLLAFGFVTVLTAIGLATAAHLGVHPMAWSMAWSMPPVTIQRTFQWIAADFGLSLGVSVIAAISISGIEAWGSRKGAPFFERFSVFLIVAFCLGWKAMIGVTLLTLLMTIGKRVCTKRSCCDRVNVYSLLCGAVLILLSTWVWLDAAWQAGVVWGDSIL